MRKLSVARILYVGLSKFNNYNDFTKKKVLVCREFLLPPTFFLFQKRK